MNRIRISRYAGAFGVLLLWYRDLLNLSTTGRDAKVVNVDKVAELRVAAAKLKPDHLPAILESLTWAARAIDGNANPQLITEALMMRILGRAT